ncbi:methyltransferase domain-containing protein [Streptomyces sp. NPDC005356]|uniref:methyltransferase domain-containing protein n=1 Tax=Streptomyces sp. NPDC005356 TaxID=3157167 RepID=UPI0033BD6460
MSPPLPRVLPSPEGKPLPLKDTADAFRAFAGRGSPHLGAAEADFLAGLFDQLAPKWDTAQATGRDDRQRDALTRAGTLPCGPCLEVGSGTGQFTSLLTSAFPTVISLDLSQQMLRQAAPSSAYAPTPAPCPSPKPRSLHRPIRARCRPCTPE